LHTSTSFLGEKPLQPFALQALAWYSYSPFGLALKDFDVPGPSYTFEYALPKMLSHSS